MQSLDYSEDQISQDITAFFKSPLKGTHKSEDSSGPNFDFFFDLTSPLQLQIKLNYQTDSMTFNLKRQNNEIEPITRINLANNCHLYQAYHTYYNQSQRPYLRIKLDSQEKEIFRVRVEEEPRSLQEIYGDESLKEKSKETLRVGFIDSGLDYNHSALAKKSRPLLGIDLTNPERPPYDYTNSIFNELAGRSYSHGTAVADIATKDLDVLIVPVRIENKSHLAGEAIEHLARNNVRLVNVSQGSVKKEDWLSFEKAALAHPEMLFIVAAGNEKENIDTNPLYPASADLPNMIVVASVNKEGRFSSDFSNYGPSRVHVAALGEAITAATAGGGTQSVHGTSMATPQVTRKAAQILLRNRNIATQELKKQILKSAVMMPTLIGKVKFGVINSPQVMSSEK
ncbi:MAG: S8 family serine peptidase [Bdellovibrio sp.]